MGYLKYVLSMELVIDSLRILAESMTDSFQGFKEYMQSGRGRIFICIIFFNTS